MELGDGIFFYLELSASSPKSPRRQCGTIMGDRKDEDPRPALRARAFYRGHKVAWPRGRAMIGPGVMSLAPRGDGSRLRVNNLPWSGGPSSPMARQDVRPYAGTRLPLFSSRLRPTLVASCLVQAAGEGNRGGRREETRRDSFFCFFRHLPAHPSQSFIFGTSSFCPQLLLIVFRPST